MFTMLTKLCENINNWFETEKYKNTYTINNGVISPLDFIKDGQFFRIVGSVFNDGVYQKPFSGNVIKLTDEEFEGEIWAMSIPTSIFPLVKEIEEFNEKSPISQYKSESFGGYSYSKAEDSNGQVATWETVFGNRLNRWRKL